MEQPNVRHGCVPFNAYWRSSMASSFELWVDQPAWKVTLRDTDGVAGVWTGDGLSGGALHGATERTLARFIAAAMEAFEYKQRTGHCSDNIDMFPLDMLQAL